MEFEDNSKEIKAQLNQSAYVAVEAALMIVESDYKANTRVDSGETRDSITHTKPKQEGTDIVGKVGGTNMNHIWEEFGTGEYATHGDGRKGGWAYYDKKTKKWHFTRGKSANPALKNAFRNNKNNIKKALDGEFSKLGG